MKKRLISLILAVSMMLSILPTGAFAASAGAGTSNERDLYTVVQNAKQGNPSDGSWSLSGGTLILKSDYIFTISDVSTVTIDLPVMNMGMIRGTNLACLDLKEEFRNNGSITGCELSGPKAFYNSNEIANCRVTLSELTNESKIFYTAFEKNATLVNQQNALAENCVFKDFGGVDNHGKIRSSVLNINNASLFCNYGTGTIEETLFSFDPTTSKNPNSQIENSHKISVRANDSTSSYFISLESVPSTQLPVNNISSIWFAGTPKLLSSPLVSYINGKAVGSANIPGVSASDASSFTPAGDLDIILNLKSTDLTNDIDFGTDGKPSTDGTADIGGGTHLGDQWRYDEPNTPNGGNKGTLTLEPDADKNYDFSDKTISSDIVLKDGATISGGNFTGSVTNEGGTISGGSFSGNVTNKKDGTISGGTFTGEVTNEGTISGGTFTDKVTNDGGTISGGNFAKVDNKNGGTIIGGIFLEKPDNVDSNTLYTIATADSTKLLTINDLDITQMPVYFVKTASSTTTEAVLTADSDILTMRDKTVGDIYNSKYLSDHKTVEFTLPEENVIINAKHTINIPDDGNGSDSGNISIKDESGNDMDSAEKGEKVYLSYGSVPAGKKFKEWQVTAPSGPVTVYQEGDLYYFYMPDEIVTIKAIFEDINSGDSGSGGNGGSSGNGGNNDNASGTGGSGSGSSGAAGTQSGGGDGAGVALAAVVGGVAIGGAAYMIGTQVWLESHLPGGTAIPTNREQLALLLWNTAGRPVPESDALFADIPAGNAETQQAARWCVKKGLMSANGDSFNPDGHAFRLQVINAWNDLQDLLSREQ